MLVGRDRELAELTDALSRIAAGGGLYFFSGEPGIGLEVAKWVVEKDLCLTGGDTWAVEVVPNPDKSLAFPVHGELICKHGIFNHENLIFDELIADKKYQFVFVFVPAPIKGATGSNGSPIAVT